MSENDHKLFSAGASLAAEDLEKLIATFFGLSP